jgi:hypothetical protein
MTENYRDTFTTLVGSACRGLTRALRHWEATIVVVLYASAAVMLGCGDSSARVVAKRISDVEVMMLPFLRGGMAGWCITMAAGGGCPVSVLKSGPIVAEWWLSPSGSKRAEGFALTKEDVAGVLVGDSRRIDTLRARSLPQDWRAVVVKIRGRWAPEVLTPSLFGRPPHKAPVRLPRFIPVNAAGEVVKGSNEHNSLAYATVAGKSWRRPSIPPGGPCELRSSDLVGLTAQAGFVISRATSVNDLIGDSFLSCASTTYSFDGWPLVSSVLMNARHPGVLPGRLPRMRMIIGFPGTFEALGSNGPMVARRISQAWLVVSGGRGLQQRLMVLQHLRASVHL